MAKRFIDPIEIKIGYLRRYQVLAICGLTSPFAIVTRCGCHLYIYFIQYKDGMLGLQFVINAVLEIMADGFES